VPSSVEEKHRPDSVGLLLFALPPVLTALVWWLGLSLAYVWIIPPLLALIVAFDAPRWGLRRWLWVVLVLLFWLLLLPVYGFMRRYKGAPVHWGLGLLSIATFFVLLVMVASKQIEADRARGVSAPDSGGIFHDWDDD
jgi:hypothetical protein